jgi:hypothetical protein
MIRPILSIELIVFLLSIVAASNGQTETAPTVSQSAKGSTCANIVALSGAKVNCSNLTPEQKNALANIPSILKMALENQGYLEGILRRLNEMSAPQQPVITNNAPGGFAVSGGTLINPRVTNLGPPPANLTFREEVLQPLQSDGSGVKLLKIHIATDRAIPGAIIGVVMSGPITMTKEFYNAHNPTQEGSGTSQVDMTTPLVNGTVPIPNSFALKIGIPAAFYPGVDLALVVESHVDVHVLQVAEVQR